MTEEIIELKGKEEGPTSMILAGVHGDERCGIEALGKLLPTLGIRRGRVLIGYGNPRAIGKGVRSTETNLNRMFKPDSMLSEQEKNSYEYRRAQFLKPYLAQAGALLDIHASATPQSPRFVICEPIAFETVSSFPVERVVVGFDAVQPGGTDYFMNSIGKIGICAECGYEKDPASVVIAQEYSIAFLAQRGHIDGKVTKYAQEYVSIDDMYVTKTDTFVLARPFGDFEKIKKSELIGKDGDKEILATKDGLILFARSRNQIGQEAFLFGEYKKRV